MKEFITDCLREIAPCLFVGFFLGAGAFVAWKLCQLIAYVIKHLIWVS